MVWEALVKPGKVKGGELRGGKQPVPACVYGQNSNSGYPDCPPQALNQWPQGATLPSN